MSFAGFNLSQSVRRWKVWFNPNLRIWERHWICWPCSLFRIHWLFQRERLWWRSRQGTTLWSNNARTNDLFRDCAVDDCSDDGPWNDNKWLSDTTRRARFKMLSTANLKVSVREINLSRTMNVHRQASWSRFTALESNTSNLKKRNSNLNESLEAERAQRVTVDRDWEIRRIRSQINGHHGSCHLFGHWFILYLVDHVIVPFVPQRQRHWEK